MGRPDQARRTCSLTEGIETGPAVALAFKAEIADGRVAVAAAVSAVGMEAFQPWPATRRVTVAADRDEAPKPDGRPGSRRGERAARTFALAHRERIQVAIALPGAPGESIDWLDALNRDRVEAVRVGITTAEPFAPTRTELEEQSRGRDHAAALERAQRRYPLPAMDTVRLAYAYTDAGRIKVHKLIDKDPVTGEAQEVWLPVATPFGVTARLRRADQEDGYGIRVVVEDMAGEPRDIDFNRGDLARMGAAEVRAQLFEAGLRTEGEGEAIAVQVLKAADPAREVVVVSRPGWHRLSGMAEPVFVTPAGAALGAPDPDAIGLAQAGQLAGPGSAGSLEGWRHAIGAAVLRSRCPHWILGAVASYAGPLIDLCGFESCGLNLSGLSTSGKTTAQRLAVSAWASPLLGAGLLQSMRSTENALESLGQLSSGTVLALDELAHADGRVVARMIYSLASGIGKARMTSGAELKGRYAWRTFLLLSGECSLEEKVRADGGTWTAGAAARIADVDVTGIDREVDQATLDAIDGIRQHFGHAGPAFVRALIAQRLHRKPDTLRARVVRAATGIAGTGDSARLRAALPFALLFVAGQLAVSIGLLPKDTPVADAVGWAWERFVHSSDAAVLAPDEQALNSLRTWIAERWDVTIKAVETAWEDGDARRINNRESLAWYDDEVVYLPTRRAREASGGALKELHLARLLADRSMLARRDKDRFTVRYVPKIGHVQCYALRRCDFGRTAAPAFTVHEGGRR